MEYFAFGETFIEEHKNSHNSPFLYNGKEFDEESGYTYFGARYLDMRYSIWTATDPLSGYNPIFEKEHYIDGQHNKGVFNSFNHATYSYCYQNPVALVDPNGKQSHFMHGTNMPFSTPWDPATYFGKNLRNSLKSDFGSFDSWRWSGSLWSGGDKGRIKEGHRLSSNVIKSIVSNIKKGKYIGKGIMIGGHSHGGNVANIIVKDVYNHLEGMVKAGKLDEMPTMNLLRLNTPRLDEEAYKLTPQQSASINVIEVNAKSDYIQATGQALGGTGAATSKNTSDADHKINYKSQSKDDTLNHMGNWDENAKVWYPEVKKVTKKP